jgi:thiol-disulfide isomerase/thioredoxin
MRKLPAFIAAALLGCSAITAIAAASAATSATAPAAAPAAAPAPDFAGIEQWHNSAPLTMQQLRGKVVLVDFWTYTCINCIRTLPHVAEWHRKYKDQGLVVVGVHTPEFPFERSAANVKKAVKRFDISYPVAQDNRYATWNAYSNQFWPAVYLIDRKGQVVYTHFGEGAYAQTEATIRTLLAQNR